MLEQYFKIRKLLANHFTFTIPNYSVIAHFRGWQTHKMRREVFIEVRNNKETFVNLEVCRGKALPV